jgi:hypothetical protein
MQTETMRFRSSDMFVSQRRWLALQDLPLVRGTGARKDFFFEKKKQKTFGCLSRIYQADAYHLTKVFWFFFSKKNCFLP